MRLSNDLPAPITWIHILFSHPLLALIIHVYTKTMIFGCTMLQVAIWVQQRRLGWLLPFRRIFNSVDSLSYLHCDRKGLNKAISPNFSIIHLVVLSLNTAACVPNSITVSLSSVSLLYQAQRFLMYHILREHGRR